MTGTSPERRQGLRLRKDVNGLERIVVPVRPGMGAQERGDVFRDMLARFVAEHGNDEAQADERERAP